VSADTWSRLGGFCEQYAGYGGEDTDFAWVAASLGVPLIWVGGAHAYHQHHPVSDPPVEHLEEIVVNARTFRRRWGRWPMAGWLDAFEERGLLIRDGDEIRVTTPETARLRTGT
jgi:GT2 family glycosyltransferase